MRHFIFLFVITVLIQGCSTQSSDSNTQAESTDEPKSEDKLVKGSWKVFNVTDEFGDVIPGKSTIAADFKGKMANSATSDADLVVRFQLQDSTLLAGFYEYGREPQKRLPESKFIKLKVKLANGELKTVEQFLYQNFMVDNKQELYKLLKTETSPFKILADLSTVDKYDNTTYNYEIDPTGFTEIIRTK